MYGGRDIELRVLRDKDPSRTYKILFYLLESDSKSPRIHLPRKPSCHVFYGGRQIPLKECSG